MTKIRIMEAADHDDFIEILVELHFEEEENNSGLNQLIRHVSNIMEGDVAQELQPLLIHLELSPEFMKARFRYMLLAPISQRLQQISDEEKSRVRMNFLFYFAAKIDTYRKIIDGEIPPSFRYFLDLPSQLNTYYGWNLTS
jgi:hypothetical protein